jgi:hypothetical protein
VTDRRRRRTALRAGPLAPIAVLLTACGIQPTAVVDAGAPPSGFVVPGPAPVISGPAASGEVYFVSAGQLTPTSRPSLPDRGFPRGRDGDQVELITLSVQELLIGPSADEVAIGISSELQLQPSQTPLGVSSPEPGTVQLVIDMVSDELSSLAALQITCTVRAAAQAAGRSPDVIVQRRHDDGRIESLPGCPSRIGS